MTPVQYRMVVGVDGSAGAANAIAFVKHLPIRTSDEVIVTSRPAYILEARGGEASVASRLAATARDRARQLVDGTAAMLRESGITARGVVGEGVDAVDAIMQVAAREKASVVVVGSRGRGPWASLLLGSTARSLAILSPIPVLVVRSSNVPIRVLAATDGSPAAHRALDAFAKMPQSEGANVELLSVLPMHDWGDDVDEESLAIRESVEHDEEDAVAARLESERSLVAAGVASRTQMERGQVGEQILARADAIGADLIVIGTRGMSGPRARFWGSTAERVLTQARCNVLIAPAPAIE
ncbi:MAG TPA: universal stress protein [Candidatus Limnocylindria bacterium]